MRSKGSRFTLGVWGLRVCSLNVAFTVAKPSATVRNRPQPFVWGPYGRAYGKFCRRDHFGRFQTSGCFVSRGRRGTSWHSATFCNVSKVVLCGRRNTFATFCEDAWQISWQAQHFRRVHRHFSWEAQHFRRVVLRGFCKSHWQSCVKWRQGANSVAGVAFCAMCWKYLKIDGSLARNIDFEVANFHVLRKTRRKTSILKLIYKVWKLEEVSHEMLVLVLPPVSSRVIGFMVVSPCLWGKLQNMSLRHVSKCENSRTSRTTCSLWCSHVSRLESLVFLWFRRVYGGSRKTSPFKCFHAGCHAWHFVTFQPVW